MAIPTNKAIKISQKHLLGIQDLSINDVNLILDEAKDFIKVNQSKNKKIDVLKGKTQINLFFEPSTRTQSSFELAGKRLGADVMSMNISNSAIKKGETLIDTAMTLNAMHPDIIVIRHQDSGACNLLSQKVNCAVLNAGDGRREHPTQALLDALTIINRKKKIEGLKIYLNQGDKDIDQSLSVTDLEQIFENFFFDNLEISEEDRIGEEGKGFRYIFYFIFFWCN